MTLTRRALLRGLGALLCAPAIVRVSAIMPVKAMSADVLQLAHDVSTGRTIFMVSGEWRGDPTWSVIARSLETGELRRLTAKFHEAIDVPFPCVIQSIETVTISPDIRVGAVTARTTG